jgi:timeless
VLFFAMAAVAPQPTPEEVYHSDADSDGDVESKSRRFGGLIRDHKYMADLLAICTGIGATEKETLPNGKVKRTITKGDDCEECIHDLQRYLRKDDEEKSMHRMLGNWRVLQSKLLPLVSTYHTSEPGLVFSVTKVLVMLTMPPEETGAQVIQENSHLVRYKEAFLSQDILAIFVSMLEEPLSHDGFDRTDDDNMLIELVLTLFRNLLHVPNPEYTTVSGGEHLTHLQEDFIILLHQELVLETVLLLAQLVEDDANRDWNLLLLELFYLLFRGHSPELVANETGEHGRRAIKSTTTVGGKRVTQKRDFDPLYNMILNEHERKLNGQRNINSRHSKFGGAFVLTDECDAKGSKTVLHSAWTKSADQMKTVQPTSKSVKMKQRLADSAAASTASLSGMRPDAYTVGYGYGSASSVPMVSQRKVRLVLKSFASQFIEKAYPALMRSLVRDFRRESARLLPSDMIQYIYVSAFCTSFHRQCEDARLADSKARHRDKTKTNPFSWGPVQATMDLWSFHFTVKSIDRYVDLKDWVATGVSVALLKEMVLILDRLRRSGDADLQRTADQLINVVFYEREIIDLVPRLLGRCHTAGKNISAWFVTDLVETAHVILDITEHLAEHKMFVLQRRKKIKEKFKMKPWSSEEIAALEEGVKKYGKGKKKFELILKSPEFGPVFRDGRIPAELQMKLKIVEKLREEGKAIVSDDEEGEEGEDNAAEKAQKKEEAFIRKECEFKFNTFMHKFAQNSVYQVYLRLLYTYATNSPKVNHCIVKLLFRLTKLEISQSIKDANGVEIVAAVTHEPVMFQLSTLIVFEKILNDPGIKHSKEHRELLDFSKSVVRHFFRLAKKNPLMYVEILFNRPRRMNELLVHAYDADAMYASQPKEKRSNARATSGKGGRRRKQGENALNDSDLEGEEEGMFDSSKYGELAREKQERRAREADEAKRSRRLRRRWGLHEDALLEAKFPALRHLDSVYEILALEDLLQDKDRTAAQIKNRVKALGLLDGTNKSARASLSMETAHLKRQVAKVLEQHIMRGAAAAENAGRDAVKTIERKFAMCAAFREELAMRLETEKAMGDGKDDEEIALATQVGFALVPLTQDEFAQLSNKHVQNLLKVMQMQEPTSGECFWRIPGAFSAAECRERLSQLQTTVRELDLSSQELLARLEEDKAYEGIKEYDGLEGDDTPSKNSVHIEDGGSYYLESCQDMMMSATHLGSVSADRITSGQWESFRFLAVDGVPDAFAIRTHHGHFITVAPDGAVGTTTANMSEAGESAIFSVAYQSGRVTLQHASSKRFLATSEEGKVECGSAMAGSSGMWRAKKSEEEVNDLPMPVVSSSISPQKGKRRVSALYESSDSDDDSDDELKDFFASSETAAVTSSNIEANVDAPGGQMQDIVSENIGEGEGIDEEDENDQHVDPIAVSEPTNARKKRRTIIDDDDDDDDE